MSMNSYRIINQAEVLSRQAEWQALVNRSSNQTIFLLPAYQIAWLKHFTTPDQLQLNGFVDQENNLVAILPFFWEDNQTLRVIGAADLSDYLDLVIEPSLETEIYPEIINFLETKIPTWQTLKLESLPQTSKTLSIFKTLSEKKGWLVSQKEQTLCPVILLPQTWDEYLATLEPKAQQNFRRLLKTIGAEDEISYRCLQTPTEVTNQIDSFIQLHQASGTEKKEFWTPEREAFFKKAIPALAAEKMVRLYFLDVDGQPAACLLLFEYHNQFLLYNSGFDAYRFGHLGVGNALLLHTIKEAISLGRTRYDFMRGSESYKSLFGVTNEVVYDLEIKRN